MTGIGYTPVMQVALLQEGPRSSFIVPHRVRLRDRLRARLRSVELDRALAAGARPEQSAALELRARNLIAARTRSEFGHSIRRIARPSRSAPSVVRVPAAGTTLADSDHLLHRLARRLLAPAPVDARGMAQVRLLLSDGSGPLFDRRRASELGLRLEAATQALEPRISEQSL